MTTYAAGQTCRSRDLRCVTGEDKVTSFGLIVTREASFHQSLVARFAVFEVSEPPASRRGVLCGVLDHKLNVRGRAGNERLGSAKDFVVFLRWDVTVVQSRNDCTVRERNLALAIGLNRYIVAQNGSKTVEVAFFVGHGDQLPVAVSGGNIGYENRGGLCIGVCGSPRGHCAALSVPPRIRLRKGEEYCGPKG